MRAEIERIWAAIDQRDDWSLLEDWLEQTRGVPEEHRSLQAGSQRAPELGFWRWSPRALGRGACLGRRPSMES